MTVNEDSFTSWKHREEIAESMIPIIGKLHRERDVTVLLHSRSLVNKSVVSILKTHRFARQISGQELSVTETLPFLQALTTLDLGPSQIDLGLLAATYRTDDRGLSVAEFTAEAVAGATGAHKIDRREPRDVVLYGFGRIGRLLARLLIEKSGSGNGLRLRAIVVRRGGEQDIVKRASLLRRDSVHGQFQGTITVDEANSAIVANGNTVKVIYADDPSQLDYTAYGIKNAILIDNTGKWRDREGLSQHLRPGVDKVVLTAPGKGDVPNIVHGVNHDTLKPDEQILSCASCTTNAIVPPLKAMADEYGVLRGHVETVHSFTNDQNLLDNYHKSERRGRSAPLNMVITETGAASAVAKALPDLDATITGSSIRVPVPNVSIAILNLQLGRAADRAEVLEYLREVSLTSPLKRQIDFISAPDAVSSDFIGSRHASIVDAGALKVEGDNAILYLWYDNECRLLAAEGAPVSDISWAESPARNTRRSVYLSATRSAACQAARPVILTSRSGTPTARRMWSMHRSSVNSSIVSPCSGCQGAWNTQFSVLSTGSSAPSASGFVR
ncbi:glyceraldehyde-3-phosphate dehydrogenase [Streptomyces hirsutus]